MGFLVLKFPDSPLFRREVKVMWTPCDTPDYNGVHHCPYEDSYTGYAGEMCRTCCGLGVDEDSYPEEEYDEEEKCYEY